MVSPPVFAVLLRDSEDRSLRHTLNPEAAVSHEKEMPNLEHLSRRTRSRSRPEPNGARPLSAVKARPGTGAPPELTRTGVWSQVPCLAAAVALCTEFTSNVVLGLLAHTAGALQLEPLQLMVPATLGCSFAFMLPVATPPNAIAFATGWIPLRDMLQRGLVMNVVGVGLVAVLMPLLGQCRKASSRRSKLELLTSGNGRLATLPFP
jgi:hypothetical protein